MKKIVAALILVAQSAGAYAAEFPLDKLQAGDIGSAAPLPAQEDAPAGIADVQEKYLALMRVRQGWNIAGHLPELKVGVVDSGFDYAHPALAGRVQKFFSYRKDGVVHQDIVDIISHGTGVAGIISGDGRVTGLCPNCVVLAAEQGMIPHVPLILRRKYRKEHPGATQEEIQKYVYETHMDDVKRWNRDWQAFILDSIYESVAALTDGGARVINVSENIKDESGKFARAVQYAQDRDVVVVISAGNAAIETADYPGDAENLVVAGETTLEDKRFVGTFGDTIYGSNYGSRLTVMATSGTNMPWAVPHDPASYSGGDDSPVGPFRREYAGAYSIMDEGGTSSAAPMVAALAGMVRAARPELSAKEVISILKLGADDIGEKGFDKETGWGRINFEKTLGIAKVWKGPGDNTLVVLEYAEEGASWRQL